MKAVRRRTPRAGSPRGAARSERPPVTALPSAPGTYALLLDVAERGPLRIGRLGEIAFEAGAHLYLGSAFGPGGLAGRLGHHLGPIDRPHWHVDHLRARARVVGVWLTTDARRLECAWATAARALRGARPVAGFGASDCRCEAHLYSLPRRPRVATFRRHLRALAPRCDRIRVIVGGADQSERDSSSDS